VQKIPKQEYTAEFKEQAVRRAQEVGVGVASRELGLVVQTLRNWAKAAASGKLNAAGAKAVTPEEMELSRLRAENARLKMHVEILKKGSSPISGERCPDLEEEIGIIAVAVGHAFDDLDLVVDALDQVGSERPLAVRQDAG
jgi:transposase